MQFNTPFNRTPSPGEINSGKELVERAGYVPTKKQIETYMLAGKRLAAYRASQGEYDFAPGTEIDEDFSDPTRDGDFDLADAAQLSMSVEKSLQASSEARREDLQAQADAKALEDAKALIEAHEASKAAIAAE